MHEESGGTGGLAKRKSFTLCEQRFRWNITRPNRKCFIWLGMFGVLLDFGADGVEGESFMCWACRILLV